MDNLSRRQFGKELSVGTLGALAAGSGASAAVGQGTPAHRPKRTTAALREMINGPGIIAAPGVYDPFTARIAESIGFRALDLPGSALGYTKCVMEPNLGLEDMAEAAEAITAAVSIPLVVDAGAGFGEPAHVFHTVRQLEHAGAAGMHLEDQIYPKRFHYHIGVEHTIPVEEMVEKIHWAAEARRDPDFIIVARTDAIRTVSFAEGIRRANVYLEAGADMIMIYPRTAEQVRQIPKEVHGPINWTQSHGLPGTPPVFPLQELEAMGGGPKRGYKLINYVGPVFAVYKTVRDMFTQLKETGSPGMDPAIYGPIQKEIQNMVGLRDYIRIENATTEKT